MKNIDIKKIRQDFPFLSQLAHGHPLVYLDNAATSQKPQSVIDALHRYYHYDNANIHRGIHLYSERATKAFEETRSKIQRFINAREHREIIFVRSTTEAINLVAQSYGRTHLTAGDEIIISELEHHSNIVPWQLLCEQIGTVLKVAPINDAGDIILEEYERLLNHRTKLVALSHISNALGTVNPVRHMTEMAHRVGAVVLLDGAQAIAHTTVDVQHLGCDFYAFSGHKALGPTGIGVLYGKLSLLEAMPPYQGGGNMIRQVSFKQKTTFSEPPYKFEAGTPHISGVIGLGAAIDYLQALGFDTIATYEQSLLDSCTAALQEMPGLTIIGTSANKTSIVSFTLEHAHPHDVGTILDHQGIAVRAGHHCAMPIMERYNIPATTRVSLAFYNTHEEIDLLVAGLHKVSEILK